MKDIDWKPWIVVGLCFVFVYSAFVIATHANVTVYSVQGGFSFDVNHTCNQTNPYTSACSCASGYTARLIICTDGQNGLCGGGGNEGYICDQSFSVATSSGGGSTTINNSTTTIQLIGLAPTSTIALSVGSTSINVDSVEHAIQSLHWLGLAFLFVASIALFVWLFKSRV